MDHSTLADVAAGEPLSKREMSESFAGGEEFGRQPKINDKAG